MSAMLSEFTTPLRVISDIGSDELAFAYLAEKRWGDSCFCPLCLSSDVDSKFKPNKYLCRGCAKYFSPRTNTIFEDGENLISLRDWFIVLVSYLTSTNKKKLDVERICLISGVDESLVAEMILKIKAHIEIHGDTNWDAQTIKAKKKNKKEPVVKEPTVIDTVKPIEVGASVTEQKINPIDEPIVNEPTPQIKKEEKSYKQIRREYRQESIKRINSTDYIPHTVLSVGERDILFRYWVKVAQEIDIIMDQAADKLKAYAPYELDDDDYLYWGDNVEYLSDGNIAYPKEIADEIHRVGSEVFLKIYEIIDIKNGHNI